MTAVFSENTTDRKAETWAKQLKPFEHLEFAISDAAKGIATAVAEVAQSRHEDSAASPLAHGLDVFHTVMEAKRVLTQHWRRTEAAWEKAESTAHKVTQSKQQGSMPEEWLKPPAPHGDR